MPTLVRIQLESCRLANLSVAAPADCQKVLPHRATSFAAMTKSCQLTLLADLSDLISFRRNYESRWVFCLSSGFTGHSATLSKRVAKLMAQNGKLFWQRAAPMRYCQLALLGEWSDLTPEEHKGKARMILCGSPGSTGSSRHVAKLTLGKRQTSSWIRNLAWHEPWDVFSYWFLPHNVPSHCSSSFSTLFTKDRTVKFVRTHGHFWG